MLASKTAPRGERDKTREAFRAAVSAAEQAESEWEGEKGGGGQEEGRSKEGAGFGGGVHGRRGVVEMVPGGGLGGERRGVGDAVLPVCETAPQKDMIFRRIVRGGRMIMPGDRGVLEVQPDRGRESEDDQE